MDEKRQYSIVYQNQSHLALAILIHNSNGKEIRPEDVVKLTLKLLKPAIDPLGYLEKLNK